MIIIIQIERLGKNQAGLRVETIMVGRIVGRTLLAILALAVLVFGLAVWRMLSPISTPPFRSSDGRILPNSIAVIERWPINGVGQSVVIRGADLSNPALIWVGDLWCETPALRHFNAELEDHFVVVYWCQRYSGQSLDPFAAPPKTLTLDQYVADLGGLVDGVRARLHKDKVVLVGHSSGTALGLVYTQRHPEHVAAYVGVGQIVNEVEGQERSYGFALAEAHARHNTQALAQLDRIGPPPYADDRSNAIVRKWTIAFGGAFHGGLSYSKLAVVSAASPEANWRDLTAFARTDHFVAPMYREMSGLAFDKANLKFEAPIFLLSGRYDHRTDAALAENYLDRISAPQKAFVWFERSAHSPPFEEPAAFNAWVAANIRPIAAAP
jgi:proline iminopeptidase